MTVLLLLLTRFSMLWSENSITQTLYSAPAASSSAEISGTLFASDASLPDAEAVKRK